LVPQNLLVNPIVFIQLPQAYTLLIRTLLLLEVDRWNSGSKDECCWIWNEMSGYVRCQTARIEDGTHVVPWRR